MSQTAAQNRPFARFDLTLGDFVSALVDNLYERYGDYDLALQAATVMVNEAIIEGEFARRAEVAA